ncbi:hypothetical protein GCM10010439_06160 [Actinocorallia aurantiaca]|uniref:Uncharacterized protein n=1 Tax=Actinocorallia aurantiaca TaxID=46204 RepID=A0ABN3TX76_9ACTN
MLPDQGGGQRAAEQFLELAGDRDGVTGGQAELFEGLVHIHLAGRQPRAMCYLTNQEILDLSLELRTARLRGSGTFGFRHGEDPPRWHGSVRRDHLVLV